MCVKTKIWLRAQSTGHRAQGTKIILHLSLSHAPLLKTFFPLVCFFFINQNINDMSYFDKAKDIYDMSSQGKLLDAFEKYYHDDVVMIEANGETREGKELNRKFQIEFMNGVKEVHGTGIRNITSNEGEATTMVESWMDATYQDGSRHLMEEVAVQKWKDDKIIHERFYYNMGS